jgi:type IV secretory pathway VirJ component
MSLLHVVLALFAGAGLVAERQGPAGLIAGAPLERLNVATTLQSPAGSPQSSTVDYGLFGPLHLSRPGGELRHTVLLFSDRDGWTPRQQGMGDALAARGAFVVGIDLPAYLKRMETIKDACSYPAGHVEEAAHWIERHEGAADYSMPLLVGDGAGATFAYALGAQAPTGTFEGLVTLGWDEGLRFSKPLCPGDAGAMTVAATGGDFRVGMVAKKLPLDWLPHPFAPGARIDGLVAPLATAWRLLGSVLPVLVSKDANTDAAALYARWRTRDVASGAALPEDVADLPLTEIAPVAPAKDPANAHRVAIIITGDGGWAGLDRGVADALTGDGVRVVGFSTLKFFWHTQTPDAAAAAIARVIAHYGAQDPDARFVLIGYSFGASLVPVIANRLPDAARARVQGGVMISPDDSAVFEIHVGDWFGSTRHDDALPLGPEIARGKLPLVCVHGADEDDSFCVTPQPAGVRVVALPGGHHYDGDYGALGRAILANLPVPAAAGQEPPPVRR